MYKKGVASQSHSRNDRNRSTSRPIQDEVNESTGTGTDTCWYGSRHPDPWIVNEDSQSYYSVSSCRLMLICVVANASIPRKQTSRHYPTNVLIFYFTEEK